MRENDLVKQISETCKFEVEFTYQPKRRYGRKKNQNPSDMKPGSVPRVTRLMALAIKFDGMIQRGEVHDFADLARLGYVTRARITQIMNLLTLAPDIQEAILSLPLTTSGRDPIREHNLRPITAIPSWNRQRKMWDIVLGAHVKPALSIHAES